MTTIDDFQVGQRVRVHRFVNPPRFRGLTGSVVTFNHEAGEIGVAFARIHGTKQEDLRPESWFLPGELADIS